MKKHLILAAMAASLSVPTFAQEAAEKKEAYPSPNEIVTKADTKEWATIPQSDLLVMDLAKDAKGKERRVIIQLMTAPFSQGWVRNIRKLADARYWDGTAVIRVQDNYVTQWGDAADEEKGETPKPVLQGLEVVPESEYVSKQPPAVKAMEADASGKKSGAIFLPGDIQHEHLRYKHSDSYAQITGFLKGWPFASDLPGSAWRAWPVHCYGMVGVGRNLSPNTGDGSSLYTVIGHAPRHLDRNIALVGRVIEGIEHLSALPRGTGPLGFYETVEERTAITSTRMGNEIADLPSFEYLSTEGASFAKYADARANRRDPFFIKPAGGADICNIPVPIRRKKE